MPALVAGSHAVLERLVDILAVVDKQSRVLQHNPSETNVPHLMLSRFHDSRSFWIFICSGTCVAPVTPQDTHHTLFYGHWRSQAENDL